MGKASACSVSLLWLSCQYPLRLECISNPGGCIWHKVSCSFLPVALVKKPGAALAGWSREVCQESELFVYTFLGLIYFRVKILCALTLVAF